MSDSPPVNPGFGPWAARLQDASFRGLRFAVSTSRLRRGRRVAVHEYPFRDDPWPEDLGRATRGVSFRGFLIGDDVYDQRDAFLTAVETKGAGTLVHPSLGTMQAVLTDFSAGESMERGRVVECEWTFIQISNAAAAQPQYPSVEDDTQDEADDAADDCDTFCGDDFVSDVSDALAEGAAVVQGAVATVTGFVAQVVGTVNAVASLAEQVITLPEQLLSAALAPVGQVIGLVNDAAIAAGAVLGLPGYFGRYGTAGLTAALPSTATVESQLAAVATSRAAVAVSAGSVLSTAANTPTSLPGAVQACVAQLVATIPSPADQLRILATLAAYQGAPTNSTAPIGAAIATAQTAVAALVRRAALAGLVRAAAAYQPTSYNDAYARVTMLTGLLDTEMVTAADAGDQQSYLALRAARTACQRDLITRGLQVPQLTTVTRPRSLNSLLLAWQLYGDSTRADELVARANPVNALFMPLSFQALAS